MSTSILEGTCLLCENAPRKRDLVFSRSRLALCMTCFELFFQDREAFLDQLQARVVEDLEKLAARHTELREHVDLARKAIDELTSEKKGE